MLAGFFRDSGRDKSQAPPAWGAIIDSIDKALADIESKFRLAFSEGYVTSIPTKHFIKREVFSALWRLLAKKSVDDFDSLVALDEHFNAIHETLPERINNYCLQKNITQLCEQANLDTAISESKKQMLFLLAKQYHALVRTKFILFNIKNNFSKSPYGPEDCIQGVTAFRQQCELVPDMIRDIDLSSYSGDYVEAVIQLNHKLIQIFRDSGYGNVDSEKIAEAETVPEVTDFHDNRPHSNEDDVNDMEMMVPIEYKYANADRKFMGLYRELHKLMPLTAEMNALVKEKPSDDRNRALIDGVIKLELARNLLVELKDKLIAHHVKKMQALQRECEALRSSIEGVRANDKYHSFFQQLYLFVVALVNKDESKGVLGLIPTGTAVTECAGQQSYGAKYLGRNNGWNDAIKSVEHHTSRRSEIDLATNAIFKSYTESRRIYNQASKMLSDLDNDWLANVNDLVNKWTSVLADTEFVIHELGGLIDRAQNIWGRCAESNAEYWKGFIKRHWWKGALIAVLPVGGGVATGVLLLHSTVAAVGLPFLGVVLGGASGAGVGLAQDSKNLPPPNKKPEVDDELKLSPIRSVLDELFESEEMVIRKDKGELDVCDDEFKAYFKDDSGDEAATLLNLSSDDEGEEESREISSESRWRNERILLFSSVLPNEQPQPDKTPNHMPVFTLE